VPAAGESSPRALRSRASSSESSSLSSDPEMIPPSVSSSSSSPTSLGLAGKSPLCSNQHGTVQYRVAHNRLKKNVSVFTR
jgi:hypothetical protein